MTVNTSIKALDVVGADFYNTDTTPAFAVGQKTRADNGTLWVYVKAGSAIKQYDCVVVDEVFSANSITNTNAKKGYRVGWAQQSGGIASGSYGWVAIQGTGIKGRVKAVLNHTNKVYCPASASGSAGVLRASATARVKILGVVTVTTASGSSKSVEIQATWPLINF